MWRDPLDELIEDLELPYPFLKLPSGSTCSLVSKIFKNSSR